MIERYLSKDELRRLVSALLVVCTFLAIAFVFAFLVVPGLRNANQRTQDPAVNPPQGETGWLDPTDYPAEKGRTVPPVDPATVMQPNPELLARGRGIYAQTCASCHGEGGRGDGPAAAGLTPRPRNLTVPEGWKNGPGLAGLYRTLEEGLKGTNMVAYAYLSRKDRMALAHHVQTLGTFDRGTEDPRALDALARQFSGGGEVIPNRIPVKAAMDRLAAEARTPAPLASGGLLDRAVKDPSRAALTLAALKGWRESDQVLAQGLLPGLPANGFAPQVATFTPAQWRQLRTELAAALRP